MKAKKSLGQHFLRSEKALRAIVETGDINHGETILEIGPGRGVLTKKLLEAGAKVIAVEKDDELYELLRQVYEKEIENGKLELIHGDIIEFDLSKLAAKTYKLVANIPYNITGAILKKFLETNCQPERIVLLVQKEVAKRIVAQDGKESILSVSVKVYGAPRYIETVKAGSFTPMPKVDSAIILIDNISKKYFAHFSEKDFFTTVRTGFKSKRKKLSSNLSAIFAKEKVLETFRKLNLDENLRAEDVGIETWGKLVTHLCSD
ncbi:MAG: 16S rRNA (adenine(1518)-N(6)/adenine(1519)-N(6))-dimethyltransferase RsmA [bacterium]|nr:16S rRNA (adenine(1518)-N(6)/adenine(1519)-N(6))-dimethyltransferase RsmA [bacterium]